ncbi:hypothetical protein EYF80_059391 [Liparis tanakae]|uniref:Uncharacterized protein n=1 Tax=Liparis tanakae TaxID=230148 RepID=A0A4Z2ENT2_9TELE|nr:hypothetical protein EYF80_059391 [Liparis tanakae]
MEDMPKGKRSPSRSNESWTLLSENVQKSAVERRELLLGLEFGERPRPTRASSCAARGCSSSTGPAGR